MQQQSDNTSDMEKSITNYNSRTPLLIAMSTTLVWR
jgi:hypothetical protein